MNLKSALLLSALAVSGAANADLLSLYNFNDAAASPAPVNLTALLSQDGGSQISTLTTNFVPTNVVNFAGTTVNAVGTDSAGQALALQAGGTGSGATFVGANNGANLTLALAAQPGFTLSGLSLSFANQRTGTGFNSNQFQYSTDGVNFTNFDAPYNPALSFAAAGVGVVESFDLSSIAALNNVTSASFRIVFNGATSTAGNNRIDNLQVNGTVTPVPVPEPASMAALGLGVVALVRRRRSAK